LPRALSSTVTLYTFPGPRSPSQVVSHAGRHGHRAFGRVAQHR
jgi:hypothetical protein